MMGYRKILSVVDLSEGSARVGERAKTLAHSDGARLLLLHVVEYLPVEPMGETLLNPVQIEKEMVDQAERQLWELAARLGLPESDCLVETGNIKAEIIRVAREQAVDLIVLGSRERHGLAILLNFTEDTLLHAAPCDVLAVRLHT
jgi:universal stress protein A